jgi:branched-chain amino acid transport system substrate-binding protein
VTRRISAVLLLVLAAGSGLAQDQPAPFFDARQHRTEYLGPGREEPEPEGLSEIRIGYFGPADPDHPDWGEVWRGAKLALDQANAEGGYRGKPFRLVSAWSESPWGSGVADLTKLVFADGVWAVVGGVDGVTTHLAEQIVVKAHLALVSPGNSDPSIHLTNVPWVFSLLPTDDRTAPLLVGALERESARGPNANRLVVLAATDHDSHVTWTAASKLWARSGRPAPILQAEVPGSTPDFSRLAADVKAARPSAVLVVARARDAGRLVRALRAAGVTCPIVGGPTLGRHPFILEAGSTAEGVVFPAPEVESAARASAESDDLAAAGYDAVRLVVAAIRTAGLNRARIRDAVAALGPPSRGGAHVEWDTTGRSTRAAHLAAWRAGRVAVQESADGEDGYSREDGRSAASRGAARAR